MGSTVYRESMLPTNSTPKRYLLRVAAIERVWIYYLENWSEDKGGFIAWRGRIPAGGVWLNWGTDEFHGFGHVEEGIPELALAVENRFQGEGIGTALLEAATELARQMGAP